MDDRRYLIPFRATLLPQIFTDTLVIGGVAGLRAAIAAGARGRHHRGQGRDQGFQYLLAQGGVCVVIDEQDSIDSHVEDTLIAGAGLCDEPVVRQVAQHARAAHRRAA
ncbi:MAG: FAD-binding protein [Phycisphaerales bacterium]